jgi:hypothetical protein
MERFWRTLRETCLDHLGAVTSLDDVNARLRVFLERYYQDRPHAGLLGETPTRVYRAAERAGNLVDEDVMREALMVRAQRRVGKDTTLKIEGKLYELNHGYLAGRNVTVMYSLLDVPLTPWVEEDGRRLPLHLVDVRANGTGKRPARHEVPIPPLVETGFDATGACAPLSSSSDAATMEAEDACF